MMNPIMQTVAHQSRNPETYRVIRTDEMLETFARHGWMPAETKIARAMEQHREGFQRHLVRLEHPSFSTLFMNHNGDTNSHAKMQIAVMNSHDGTTALRLFVGVLRMACLNGMIAGTAISDFRVIHSRNSLIKLEEGVETMVARLPETLEQIRFLQSVPFTLKMERDLAEACYNARLASVPSLVEASYDTRPIRWQDTAQDGFTVMNRIQERVIRGGIKYVREVPVFSSSGEMITYEKQLGTTRRCNSIQQNLRLNRLVWDKALEIAKSA